MATITKKKILTQDQFSGTAYGNHTSMPFRFATNASGYFLDSDTPAAAVGNGDKVRLGLLVAGTRLEDALAIVSDAFTASATAKIGFEYVDGVDNAAVPQDDDYFFAALAYNALGRTRAANTAVAPVTLPKDAYLILTNGGAALNAVGILDLIVYGVLTGAP
jgi:hypothetical protein